MPDELIDELLDRIRALGRPPGQILIESLHGAPKTADAPPGAVGFRQAAFNVTVMSVWLDPELDGVQIDWAREAAAAIEPWAVSGGYVNYMQADEPIERVRSAFGEETFERLQALKARYDPENVLRRNQNIPPAAYAEWSPSTTSCGPTTSGCARPPPSAPARTCSTSDAARRSRRARPRSRRRRGECSAWTSPRRRWSALAS